MTQTMTADTAPLVGRYAWYVALLLTATQVVSYVDRFLPGLLLEAIKHDLGLTDFEVGLLMGPAFGLFYVFVGVPIGWLADRRSRRAILAAGISVWCAMTATAGLVRSFVPLFLTRMGVGLGEACVAPCGVSLISDYFPRERRAPPLSLFMAGTFIGAGCAFLFGGPLVHYIMEMPALTVPLLGDLRSWQLAFVIVGLPGFALAALMFTIREPRREDQARREVAADAAGRASLGAALHFMRKRWTAFGALFVGSAAVVTMGSLSFWNVALFARTWGWGVRDVGIATGLLFFIGGSLGTLLGIWLTKRWIAAGRKDATLRALWAGLAIAVPGFALYPLMPHAGLAVAMQLFAFGGQAMAAAAGPASITLIAPGQIKAQATAIYYLCIGLFGQLLGPPPVGWMTDLFGDPASLRYAMTIEAATIGGLALALVAFGMSRYRRCVIEVDGLITPAGPAHA
ncbi:MAG: putative sialic acid transporter [Steroidobacteraceae bacterium]|nr:putative sialic acid transporter [Steroidobacteraceae bacterium]